MRGGRLGFFVLFVVARSSRRENEKCALRSHTKQTNNPNKKQNNRPPELLLGADRYGPEVDAWSVGCILAELLGRKPIFPGRDEADQLKQVFAILGFPREEDWPGVSQLEFYSMARSEGLPKVGSGGLERWCRAHGVDDPHAIDLLGRLLSLDPRKRASAREAATHDYFYEAPRACYPHELPKVDDSHELGVKKRAAAAGGGG